MPSDVDLPKLFKTSSITTIRALKELEGEGLIVRRSGSGTYVADQKKPPLIPGRHLKFGVRIDTPLEDLELKKDFIGEIVTGVLKEWGVEGIEPNLVMNHQSGTMRSQWNLPARGVTVECLGETAVAPHLPGVEEIAGGSYDGILSLCIDDDRWFSDLLKQQIPTVILDNPSTNIEGQADVVFADPHKGYAQAIRFFVEQDIKRIHFVGFLKWRKGARQPQDLPTKRPGFVSRRDPDSLQRLHAV